MIEMYLMAMDQRTREDIHAATAAHAELGSDYDRAIAEGLIERIGDEIDRRVDARIGVRQTAVTPARRADPGTRLAYWKGLGVGTGLASIVTAVWAANDGDIDPGRLLAGVIALWVVTLVAYGIIRWRRD
jgi:hypothetical protein